VLVALAGWATVFWLLWAPILRRLPGVSVGQGLKDYYLPDQFAYLSIARNVEQGFPTFVEPYTVSGSSIYPSGYYWLLGEISRLPGMSVFAAWNVVGMVVTLGLLAMATAWGAWALPGSRAWAIAPIAILLGTLHRLTTGGWMSGHGEHAVLWAPFGSLFSPGAEGPALLLLGLALLALAKCLAAKGRARVGWAAGAGALLGATLELHTYVAMFSALAMVLVAVTHEALRDPGRRWLPSLVVAWVGTIVACGLVGWASALGRLGLVLAVPLAWLLARPDWRRRLLLPAIALVGAALAVAGPLLVRITHQALDPGSFFYVRQESGVGRDLSLPPSQVLLQFLPTWLMVALATTGLWGRARRSEHDAAWLAVLLGLVGATALLVFNNAWRMDTEPYRFLPYGTLLLAVVAVPWLWPALAGDAGARARIGGAVAAVGIIATVPTTITFADATRDAYFAPPPQEAEAYRQIVGATGGALTLLDRCFRPELVKVLGGGRVVSVNLGVAYPTRLREVVKAVGTVRRGVVPPDAVLRSIGVGWFVSTNHCAGVPADALRARFGEPLRIALRSPSAIGAPADLTYEIYRVAQPG
jgi:hypothetical protein